ncbi:MAG: hypothetical protein J7L86_02450, partial [Candidatus Marinimicrobia bacterium]|nr:hypothetical protein [Candidatus Neomarinimicrobiota bacterium]
YFDSGFGRPSKELYTSLGVLLFQQINDLTDDEACNQLAAAQLKLDSGSAITPSLTQVIKNCPILRLYFFMFIRELINPTLTEWRFNINKINTSTNIILTTDFYYHFLPVKRLRGN